MFKVQAKAQEKQPFLGVSIPESQHRQLKALSERTHVPVAQIVREMIAYALQNSEKAEK